MSRQSNRILRLLALPLVCSALSAAAQTSDPDLVFPAAPPAPCAQTVRPVMPYQDCAGAIWVTKPQQYVSTTAVLGAGCISGELPSQGNTCLTSNERKTVWLLFRIFPKAGGPTAKGSYAGRLRFRIIPNDVPDQVLNHDEGNTTQGNTDYDFALFDVSAYNAAADACSAIKAATAAGSPTSVQKACNYFGYPGATGMSDFGRNYSVDDNRYALPIPVFVGQVYALAVDNFSLNATGFTLDFDVEAENNQPSARIAPDAAPIAIGEVKAGACRNMLEVSFSNDLPVSALRTSEFSYQSGISRVQPTSIAPLGVADVGSAAQRFALLFSAPLPTGPGVLATTGTLSDRYGNRLATTEAPAYLSQTIDVTGLPTSAVCPGDTMRLDAASNDYLASEGFWSANIPGELIQTGHHVRFIPSPLANGHGQLVYSFNSSGGCSDSIIVPFAVSERPDAPAIGAEEGRIFSSIPGRSEWMRGDSVITFSRFDTLQNPTPGIYRVRSLVGDCPTGWSAPFAVGITAIKQIDDFSLSVYPNPARNLIYVDMMSIGRLGDAEIELFSPQGARVRRYHISSPTESATKAIPVEGFASGMYTVRVATSGTLMAQKVFISQ